MWFWFMVGLALAVLGLLVRSSKEDIKIKMYTFDVKLLGAGLLSIGSVVAWFALMSMILTR